MNVEKIRNLCYIIKLNKNLLSINRLFNWGRGNGTVIYTSLVPKVL